MTKGLKTQVKPIISSHDKISFTAFMVAYCRTFTDIPLAKEVFSAWTKIRGYTERDIEINKKLADLQLTPYFEARYKIIDRAITESGITNILEIASGLSPRGLAMTENPHVQFVEFDLPKIVEEKNEIIRNILLPAKSIRNNLRLCPGNALNSESLLNSVSEFKGPIVIANEGLLRYLTRDEQKALARNIYTILASHGGWWITPDIITHTLADNDQKAKKRRKKIARMTGASIEKNMFKDTSEAQSLFKSLGFEVAERKIDSLYDELVSPNALKLDKEEVARKLRGRVAFIMEVKQNLA